MKYSVDKQEAYTLLKLSENNLNTLVAPDLKSQLYIIQSEGAQNVIFDLSEVEYVDSSGLSAILTGHRLWKDNGVFVVTGVQSDSVKKLIEISQLEPILNIVPSVQESIDFVKMDILEREIDGGEEE